MKMADFIQNLDPGHLTGAIASAFIILVNVLISQKNEFSSSNVYPADASSAILQVSEPRFDFVIVGAGAAGCALAGRLAQNENWKILLIEAGGDPSTSSDVPAFYHTLKRTKEDWQFVTQEDSNVCQGMIDKVCRISKGKALGGSTSINNMHYMRGNPYDFFSWHAWGNGEWKSEMVHSAFVNLEKFRSLESPCKLNDYGKEGKIRLSSFGSKHKIKEIIKEAASELSNLNLRDYYLGYYEIPGMIYNGKRFNLAKAFLTPIKDNANFFVLKNSQVTKLLIPDLMDKKIKGVECVLGHRTLKIKTNKEVILSAGALNTAKILLQSGIGPSNYLSNLNVPVVANLNVGENLQEHIGVPIFVALPEDLVSENQIQKLTDATYSYVMYQRGPLSNTNINDFVGFLNSGSDPHELPDLLIYHHMFAPNDLVNLQVYLEGIGYEPNIVKMLIKENKNQTLLVFIPTLLKPHSRGKVLLNTTDPLSQPIIQANFLQQSEDLGSLIFGFKFVARLVNTPQFMTMGAKLLYLDLPNCKNFRIPTDPYLKCYIRNLAYPQGDVVGTAKMGAFTDFDAVVDEDLLVREVSGLRVVDAAFMPEIVSANIQGTMAMVADRVSEAIIRKHVNFYSSDSNSECCA